MPSSPRAENPPPKRGHPPAGPKMPKAGSFRIPRGELDRKGRKLVEVRQVGRKRKPPVVGPAARGYSRV